MSDYSPNARELRNAEGYSGQRRRNPPPPVSTTPHESDLDGEVAQLDQSLQSISPMSGETESLDMSSGPQSFYPMSGIPMYPDHFHNFVPFGYPPPIMFTHAPAPMMYAPPFFTQPIHSEPHLSLSEAESVRTSEDQPPSVVKVEKPTKRVIAIKDPKTGQALDLSEVSSRRAATPKPVEELSTPEESVKAVDAPKSAEEAESQVSAEEHSNLQPPAFAPAFKQLKGIKNKPLDPTFFFHKPQTPAYLRMLALRIFNKPLNRPSTPSTTSSAMSDIYVPMPPTTPPPAPQAPVPARAAISKKPEQPVPAAAPVAPAVAPTAAQGGPTKQLSFPLSRATLLSLLPRERPTPPGSLGQLQVVKAPGVVVTGKSGSSRGQTERVEGKRGSQQAVGATSQWRTGSQSGGRASRGKGGRGGREGGGGGQVYAQLKMSEGGYRVLSAQELSEQEQLRRQVQSLLNKITPDSFGSITEKIASIPVTNAQSMDTIVSLVFDKAVAEHAYCEMYANMCKTLKDRWPELEMEVEDEEGVISMQKVTFVRCLIEKCQVEFDAIPQTLESTEEEKTKTNNSPEELDSIRSKKKERILGNMKFIAQLYLRNLLSTKVVKSVVDQLLSSGEEEAGNFPEEHYLECVCLVLNNIGVYLEQHAKGAEYLDAFFDRLQFLQSSGHYGKRIVYLILNLIDARRAGWRGTAISSAKLQTVVKKEEARRIPPVVVSSGNLPSRFSSQAPPVVVAAASRPGSRASSGRPVQPTQRMSPSGGKQADSRVAGSPAQTAAKTGGGVGRGGAAVTERRRSASPTSLASSSSSDTSSEEEGVEERESGRSLPSLERHGETPAASSNGMESEIKRFRDYYAEDKDFADFLRSVGTIPSHILARVLFGLGGQGDARKFETDAKLIAEVVRAEKISIAEVESCYSQFMAEIEDKIIDAPTAVNFHSCLIHELAQIDAISVADRLLIPAFCQGMDQVTSEKLLTDLLSGGSTSRLLEALRHKKSATVAQIISLSPSSSAIFSSPPSSESGGEQNRLVPTLSETTVVEDALKTGVDERGEAMVVVRKFASCDRWTLGRLEKILSIKRMAWGYLAWPNQLAPIQDLVIALVSGEEQKERSGQERMVLLTRAMMKTSFRSTDVEGMLAVLMDWKVVSFEDVDTFVKASDDVDHHAERKHAEEGLTKLLNSRRAKRTSK